MYTSIIIILSYRRLVTMFNPAVDVIGLLRCGGSRLPEPPPPRPHDVAGGCLLPRHHQRAPADPEGLPVHPEPHGMGPPLHARLTQGSLFQRQDAREVISLLFFPRCLFQLQLWLDNPKVQLTFEATVQQLEAPYNSEFNLRLFPLLIFSYIICGTQGNLSPSLYLLR